MIRVSVIYPQKESAEFDFDYYLSTHLPLVEKLFGEYGMSHWQVDKGVSLSSKQIATFIGAAYLYFDDMDAVKQAFKNQGGEVMADVKNFTTITPEVSFAQVVSES